MDIKDLTIGQAQELSKLFGAAASIPCCEKEQTQIVVLQRGWIVVGLVKREGDEIHISNASVIRAWGTTRGLGEIAADGPTSSTKLDRCPDVSAHILTVVARMNCASKKWENHVKP